MRNAFADALFEEIQKNKKIILLAGDIGNRLFDKIKKKFPKNFYNCGVAESNMTSVAAGLAKSKFKPVTYTITSFNTLKTIEQIKLDICYPNLPVIIVGVGSGLGYSNLGTTHHSLEDIGILSNIPNLNIVSPADKLETKILLKQVLKKKIPVYLRLGKKGEQDVYEKKCNSKFGKINQIKKGNKICIIGYGNVLRNAIDAYNEIKNIYKPSIYNVHTLIPLDEIQLVKILKKYLKIIIIEEHFENGGLGSKISILMNKHKILKKIVFLNTGNKFLTGLGNLKNARKKLNLDKDSIIKELKKI
tara:strand:- start:169 stop:1077 length:909 start_codon:yes stop_codon:yes gene_type:complete